MKLWKATITAVAESKAAALNHINRLLDSYPDAIHGKSISRDDGSSEIHWEQTENAQTRLNKPDGPGWWWWEHSEAPVEITKPSKGISLAWVAEKDGGALVETLPAGWWQRCEKPR